MNGREENDVSRDNNNILIGINFPRGLYMPFSTKRCENISFFFSIFAVVATILLAR